MHFLGTPLTNKIYTMIKKIGLIVLSIVILVAVAAGIGLRKFRNMWFKEKPNYFSFVELEGPMPFKWSNDSIGDFVEEKTAMVIPTYFPELDHRFYFQFDTGSPRTELRGRTLESLRDLGFQYEVVKIDDREYVKELTFSLGGKLVTARMIAIRPNYGEQVVHLDSLAKTNIGSIGSDVMIDKVLEIDFKSQYIQIHDERTTWMNKIEGYQEFSFQGRRLMLPSEIDGKKLKLFYDSGSSAFGLITTFHRFNRFSDKEEKPLEYGANNHGTSMPVVNKRTGEKIKIGNAELDLVRVSYVDMYAKFQRIISPFTRIGGWLGNKPFVNSKLIIDAKEEEFVVLENPGERS